jgi:hypothetical protein
MSVEAVSLEMWNHNVSLFPAQDFFGAQKIELCDADVGILYSNAVWTCRYQHCGRTQCHCFQLSLWEPQISSMMLCWYGAHIPATNREEEK